LTVAETKLHSAEEFRGSPRWDWGAPDLGRYSFHNWPIFTMDRNRLAFDALGRIATRSLALLGDDGVEI
jgi:hypothetical protein